MYVRGDPGAVCCCAPPEHTKRADRLEPGGRDAGSSHPTLQVWWAVCYCVEERTYVYLWG